MYYDHVNAAVKLSVRELCALAYMGGSIDNRYPARHLVDRASEGRDVHRKLREWRESESATDTDDIGAVYYPELPLAHVETCDSVTFSVEGRADGVWLSEDGSCIVEEIKSITGLPELYARAPRDRDLAQLICYGYFSAVSRGLSSVTLRLTYARVGEEDQAAHVDSVFSAEGLRGAYLALLRMILTRAKDLSERKTTVREIAKSAVFPYPDMREAQKDMILECWRDMRAGRTLFAEAPTGIGKTIATLYPAVRCLGENLCDQIFYLTAKNATRREAAAAAAKIVEAGTPIRTCVITARDQACLCEAARLGRREGRRISSYCNPAACPYAKGYYDRVESVIERMLAGGKHLFTGLDIRRAAEEGRVCPYELALDLSERCEVVICDYNYVFSPAVSLRRYFSDGIPGSEGHRYVFLVDEAHNLPDRARDMYSGYLTLSRVTALQDAFRAWEEKALMGIFPEEDEGVGNLPDGSEREGARTSRLTAAALDDLVGPLTRMKDGCAENATTGSDGIRRGVSLEHRDPTALCEAVRQISALCDRWLRRQMGHPLYGQVDDLAAALRTFRTAADYYDRRFVTFTEIEGPPDEEDVRVRLVCLDPADILRPILKKATASVLFSATLTPAAYFADILGGGKNAVTVSFDSPFPTDHLCIAVCDQINTRYEKREESYRRLVSYIAAVVSARKGNYMIYFPSYAYLDAVYERFHKRHPTVKTVVQTPGMTHAERDAFIAAFSPDSKELQIGFCVLGGSFSEGVDLPGRSLIGAMIVGVGIPGLSNERNIMREYYDERAAAVGDGNAREGYDYAYTYPGMNHVLQAAGRVIRRDDDYGVVVLLDDRYLAEPYLHLYPDHWKGMVSVGDPQSLYQHLSRFWQEAAKQAKADPAAE